MPETQQRESLLSSLLGTSDSNAQSDHDLPQSIPPWVHVNDGTGNEEDALLTSPSRIRPNTRHYKPPPPHYKTGRKWDHLRSAEPALLSAPIAEHQVRWQSFMQSGPNPQDVEGRVVNQVWMDENMPDMNPGWHAAKLEEEQRKANHNMAGLMSKGIWLLSPERQERTVRLFWRLLLKNPFIPLAFRITVIALSTAALGIAASLLLHVKRINEDADANNQCTPRASTYMAICVSSIALPYIAYVTWDEYMSKPLGLRSVAAKILLLLCDVYFVVFAASNVSLAFDALYDTRWACYDEQPESIINHIVQISATCPDDPQICYKQKALSGVLLVSLVAWLITFSISVLRVVEKLRPD